METESHQKVNIRRIRNRQTLLALSCSELETQHRTLSHQLGSKLSDCKICYIFNSCQSELNENSQFLHEHFFKQRKMEGIK